MKIFSKRSLALIILAAVILPVLCCVSCGGGKAETNDAEQTGSKEISTELIDEDDPVEVADSGSYSRAGDGGITYEGSYSIPRIKHETLAGAEELNEKIKADFDEKYADFFADDCKDKLFVNVGYSVKYEHDVLSILVTAEKKSEPDGEPVYSYTVYYYDALCDFEIDRDTYLAYLGHGTAELYNELVKTDSGVDENDFSYAILKSSEKNEEQKQIDTFDVYISGDHGDRKTELSVEKQDIDISGANAEDIVTIG